MCRLFGLNAGHTPVHIEYWLEEAPDSVAAESHRNPDGTGVGWFTADGAPHLRKQPDPAYRDPAFAAEAKAIDAITVITHVRAATTGHNTVDNCHPFLMEDRCDIGEPVGPAVSRPAGAPPRSAHPRPGHGRTGSNGLDGDRAQQPSSRHGNWQFHADSCGGRRQRAPRRPDGLAHARSR